MQFGKCGMIKRIIIVFGVIIPLVLSSLCVSGAAEETSDKYFGLKIELLAKLGLTGSSSDELPRYITRAEFVKKLAAVTGMYEEKMPRIEGITLPYTDVSADVDYYSALQLCYSLEAIDDAVFFRPDDKITLDEAAGMTASLLGYSNWVSDKMPMKLVVKRLGLKDSVEVGENNVLTGRGMIQLLHNALFTEILKVSKIYSRGSVVFDKGDTLLKTAFDINVSKGIVDATPFTSLYEKLGCGSGKIKIDGTVFSADESAYDFIGHRVDAYWRDNGGIGEIILIQDSPETSLITLDFGGIEELSERSVSYENERGKITDKRIVDSAPFLYNGKLRSFSDIDQSKITDGYINLIDNNDNGIYDVIMITSFKHIRVNSVDAECSTVYGENNVDTLVLKSKEDESDVFIEKNGVRIGVEEIQAGNVISVAESESVGVKYTRVYVSDKSVQDSVMKVKNNEITVGDTVYKYVSGAVSAALGKYGTFYIAFNGKIVDSVIENYSVYGYLYRIEKDNFDRVKVRLYSEKDRWVDLSVADHITYNGTRINAADLLSRAELFPGGEMKPQLVSYRVNKENELKLLATAKTIAWGTNEDEAARNNGEFRLSKQLSSIIYRAGASSFNYEVYLSTTSPVFVIPGAYGDGTVDTEKVYVSSSGVFEGDKTYTNMYFYDMDETGMAAVAVKYGDGLATALEDIYPVADVGSGMDKEGDEYDMLEVYINGTPVEFLVDSAYDLTSVGIRKGDVVKINMSQNGRITKAELVYRPGDPSYDNLIVNGVHNTKTLLAGTVKYINFADKRIVLNYGSDAVIYGLANLKNVYCYNAKRENYRLSDISELTIGKKVFLRASYGRIYEIVIFE